MEGKFNIDKKSLEYSYKEQIKDLTVEEREHIDDYFADDYYMIEDFLIVTYRNSLVVSLYSFLENSMTQLCRYLCKQHKYSIELSNRSIDGISSARTNLEKIAKVDFNILKSEWEDLIWLNKIRNCIVHAEGDVKYLGNNILKDHVIQTSGVSLKYERFILIEREYIDFSIDRIEVFLEKLYKQVFPNL